MMQALREAFARQPGFDVRLCDELGAAVAALGLRTSLLRCKLNRTPLLQSSTTDRQQIAGGAVATGMQEPIKANRFNSSAYVITMAIVYRGSTAYRNLQTLASGLMFNERFKARLFEGLVSISSFSRLSSLHLTKSHRADRCWCNTFYSRAADSSRHSARQGL